MREPYIEFSVEQNSYVIYENSGGLFRKQLFSHYNKSLVDIRLMEILLNKDMSEKYEEWYESSCYK